MITKVKKAKKIEIDFTRPQLLMYKVNYKLIVLSTGNYCEMNDTFSGIVVHSDYTDRSVGEYSYDFEQSKFEIFEGRIELKN